MLWLVVLVKETLRVDSISIEVIATPCPDHLQRFVDLRVQSVLEVTVFCELPESERQLTSAPAPHSGRGWFPRSLPANRRVLWEGQPPHCRIIT